VNGDLENRLIMKKQTIPSQRHGLIETLVLMLGLVGGAILPWTPVVASSTIECDDFVAIGIECDDVSPTTKTFPIAKDIQQSVSGRIMSLTVSSDGKRLYAGTFSGVWRSDNAGETWRHLTRPQPPSGKRVSLALEVPNVFDVVVSPAHKNVVLAATADDTRVSLKSQNGIYQSKDGGNSWRLFHQFKCPASSGAEGVGQIVFAPDNPQLVYAAGGCAIAISNNGGRTWVDRPIPDGGRAWHVAVAPQEGSQRTGFIRRVYAAGDDQIFYSENGGDTWFKDTSTVIPKMGTFVDPIDGKKTKFGTVGGFPVGCCGNSSQILAIEPGHPDHVFLVVTNISNGPAYYFELELPNGTRVPIPNGENCEDRVRCGGAAVWFGDFSKFFGQGQSGEWRRLKSPPAYFGVSTPSGRVYVLTKATSSGYLLFLSDGSHVHVSQGRPGQSADWHRLDGRDASQSKRDRDRTNNDDELANKLFVHVDPHAIAVSPNFEITLKPSDLSPPFDQNTELDIFVVGGTIWMGNDGGVYRSTDGGRIWSLTSGLATLQPQSSFAGVARLGTGPALYFGVPDNDNFFSPDAGATWKDPLTGCGDCGPWFSDPAQPDRVLEAAGRDNPPGFALYVNRMGGLPDASDPSQRKAIPIPGRCSGGATPPCPQGQDYIFETLALSGIDAQGYRPIILTLGSEHPLSDGDYTLIRSKPDGTRVLLRTKKLSQITSTTDWDTTAMEDGPTTKVFQQGPAFVRPDMDAANVVQASGGHESPVFYVGDPGSTNRLWKWTKGMSVWQQIVPAPDGSATIARRFFVDLYNPNLINIIDENAIKRSDNGGLTWEIDVGFDSAVTENGAFSHEIKGLPSSLGEGAVIKDMIFDRLERKMRFAVGNAGVFFTLDGEHWKRLLSTTALPGHPVAAYFDRISDPFNRALYVAMNGRGILRLSPIKGEQADLEPISPPISLPRTDFCAVVNNQIQVVVRVGSIGSDFARASITKVDFSPYGSVEVPTPRIPRGSFVDLAPIQPPPGCFDPDCDFTITVDSGNSVDEGPSGEGNNSAAGECLG